MANADKRNTRRQRILKEGRITSLDNKLVLNCSIRDVSDTGAHLKCGDQASVPAEFRLRVGHEATMRPARVVWRRGNGVGVLFTGDPVPIRRAKPKA